jgi:hypothetical protein
MARNRLRALNGGTPGRFINFHGALPAGGWTLDQINQIMGAAHRAIPDDIKNANPFNQANYDAAMIAWLNTLPHQQTVIPGLAAASVFRSQIVLDQ